MRSLLTATALALVAAAALTGSAAAKEMSVSLASGPPSGLGPGDPWKAELLVHGEPDMLAEATPGITIGNGSGGDRMFPAKATGKRAADGQLLYRARVVFPSEGRWTYALTDGVTDREYQGGTVQIGEPAAAPATPTKTPASSPAAAVDERGSSGPPWAFALGGAALLVGAAAVALVVRHRRLQPTG
jgi:hypothetical protein